MRFKKYPDSCGRSPCENHRVESRFFEPPGEKEIGSNYSEVSKTTVLDRCRDCSGGLDRIELLRISKNRRFEKSGFYLYLSVYELSIYSGITNLSFSDIVLHKYIL